MAVRSTKIAGFFPHTLLFFPVTVVGLRGRGLFGCSTVFFFSPIVSSCTGDVGARRFLCGFLVTTTAAAATAAAATVLILVTVGTNADDKDCVSRRDLVRAMPSVGKSEATAAPLRLTSHTDVDIRLFFFGVSVPKTLLGSLLFR
jgi:hypothetical protein